MEKEKSRLRKEGIKRGQVTQRLMAFRIDNDIAEWLDSKPNKSRYVNETLRNHKEFETTMS